MQFSQFLCGSGWTIRCSFGPRLSAGGDINLPYLGASHRLSLPTVAPRNEKLLYYPLGRAISLPKQVFWKNVTNAFVKLRSGDLQENLERVKTIHQHDVADGYRRVELPHTLVRKYPNANRERAL